MKAQKAVTGCGLWAMGLLLVCLSLTGCFSAQDATDARWELVGSADVDFAASQSETTTLITDHVRIKTETALAEKTNGYKEALAKAKELPAGDERDELLAAVGADWADGKAAVVKDAGNDFINYCLILAKNEAQNQALHATNEMADEQIGSMEIDLSDFVTEGTVRAVVATVSDVIKRQTPVELQKPTEGPTTTDPGTVPPEVDVASSAHDADVEALQQRLLGQAAQVAKGHGGLPAGHHNTKPGHHALPAGHHNTHAHK